MVFTIRRHVVSLFIRIKRMSCHSGFLVLATLLFGYAGIAVAQEPSAIDSVGVVTKQLKEFGWSVEDITLIGGPFGAVILGVWAFFKFFYPDRKKKTEERNTVNQYAERYKETLKAQIEKQTLSTTAFESVSVSLADTFVPLRLSEKWRNETRFMPESLFSAKNSDAILTPEEVLQLALKKTYKRLLVIGEPGSGKTTLLYYYALLCLEPNRAKELGVRIPELVFYLPLRELSKTKDRYNLLPENLWAFSEKHSHSIPIEVISGWLRSTTTLVLLDGLDEISELEERIQVCDWIDNAVTSFPKAYFIVTSRTTGYRKVDNVELKHFVRVDIMDFTLKEQKDFLHRWFEAAFLEAETPFADTTEAWKKSQQEKANAKAEAIIAFLTADENKSLQVLAGIPLLLQMMAMLWKNCDDLPRSRVELYREALNYILDYQNKPKKKKPLLPAEQALAVLTPVSLWMQEELHKDEVKKEAMQQQMQIALCELRDHPNPPTPLTFCENLIDRAGLLVEYSDKEYLFRHKSFREYLVAVQLVNNIKQRNKSLDGGVDYLSILVAHFGEAWWKEPICFFAAQADADMFNTFLQKLFDSPVSKDFSQEQQDLLERVIQEGSKEELVALHTKLLDSEMNANQQRYLLQCLEINKHPSTGDVVRQFVEKKLAKDDDIRRRAGDFTVTGRVDKQGAQYLLIQGGQFIYSVTKKQETVPDIYVARYTVTNKLYRRFIAYLDGKEESYARLLPLERYRKNLEKMALGIKGFRRYLRGNENLATLFRSRYDDDRRFNGDEQPVVGVSWYAARAYCLWLSLLDGGNTSLYRLPTEIEWEYAAGGKEQRRYPWGNEEPTSTRANYGDNEGATTPVGRYPEGKTPEGLYDMAGNVWEWMENSYVFGLVSFIVFIIATLIASISDSRIYSVFSTRSLRGGSWENVSDNLRCSSRSNNGFPRFRLYFYDGFRVIHSSHSSLKI
uniref:Putative signal transduction protein with Nacht domain n=1 Tax=Chlorobium chlorochromatii (strain CaD3) TaxID=340177 RepID=Q3ATN8_CHLCH